MLVLCLPAAPCADAYRGCLERFIVEQRLPVLFLLNPGKENGFCGFDEATLAKNISPALAKACTRAFQTDGKKYLQHWLAYQADRRWEEYYRGMFRKTGLLLASPKDVSALFDTASEHVSPTIFGEAIPTVGQGRKHAPMVCPRPRRYPPLGRLILPAGLRQPAPRLAATVWGAV
jgi:hypothetical protein